MSNLDIPLGILQRISEFLAGLPEDQIAALAEGRTRLAYIPAGQETPVAPAHPRAAARAPKAPAQPPPETTTLIEELRGLTSREDAATKIADLRKPALVAVARALSVPRAGSLTIAELRAEIIQATVGRRLESIAIRGFEGDRP
ncbi:MAG: hypothetical protein IRY85_17405 [Micromonosporaceae bacterium]|nr:hypothetical protein [Micromonosporaceae bacterium]